MLTLIKLSIKNISEKKFRSFLIVLSVALSVALLYTILSLSTTITDFYETNLTKTIGHTDLLLTVGEDSVSPMMDKLDHDSELFNTETYAYAVPLLEGFGFYTEETIAYPVRLTGMSLLDFNQVYDAQFTTEDEKDFNKNKLLIGEATSIKLGLKKGDTFHLNIGGTLQEFTIWDVYSDFNLLASGSTLQSMMIPYSTFEDILGSNNITTGYHIGLKDDPNDEIMNNNLKTLQNLYPNHTIKKAISSDDLSIMLSVIQVSLSLMTMSVLIVSCFIIFSSFNIIIIERMAFIGTLRSLGSTIKSSRKILRMESIFYGIIGGLCGILMGVLVLRMTLSQIMSLAEIESFDFKLFYPTYAVIALGVAIILVIASSFVPIKRLSKTSIKSLLFTEVKNSKHFSIVRSIIGILLIVTAFYLVQVKVTPLQMPFSFLSIIFTTIGGALMIPTLVVIIRKPLAFVLSPFVGYHSKAAGTQLTNDKTLMNNIILLSMGLGIILMINTFSASIGSLVEDIYGKCQSDIVLMYKEFDESYYNQVSQLEGVTHTYPTRDLFNLQANGTIPIYILEGIDTSYAQYAWNEFGDIFTPEFNKIFDTERTIIISSLLATKYDLKVNDSLAIEFNSKTVSYKILAVVPSIMNNGNMSFIHTKFLKEDGGIETYQGLYVKTNVDPKIILQKMKEISPLAMYPIDTLEEMQKNNADSNNSLFGLMKAISLIAMTIGTIGIFNNYVISFISRRKFLAALRSLGVNKPSLLKLFISEAIMGGLVGSLCGIAIGILLLEMMKFVLINMNISSALITYHYSEVIFVGLAGLILSILSSILPAVMGLKRPIVPELKYD